MSMSWVLEERFSYLWNKLKASLREWTLHGKGHGEALSSWRGRPKHDSISLYGKRMCLRCHRVMSPPPVGRGRWQETVDRKGRDPRSATKTLVERGVGLERESQRERERERERGRESIRGSDSSAGWRFMCELHCYHHCHQDESASWRLH